MYRQPDLPLSFRVFGVFYLVPCSSCVQFCAMSCFCLSWCRTGNSPGKALFLLEFLCLWSFVCCLFVAPTLSLSVRSCFWLWWSLVAVDISSPWFYVASERWGVLSHAVVWLCACSRSAYKLFVDAYRLPLQSNIWLLLVFFELEILIELSSFLSQVGAVYYELSIVLSFMQSRQIGYLDLSIQHRNLNLHSF